jgi:hypothetical protein
MLQFNIIEESSYRVLTYRKKPHKNNIIHTKNLNQQYEPIFSNQFSKLSGNIDTNHIRDSGFDYAVANNIKFCHVSECSDSDCVYSREKTNIRERFENKILNIAQKKNNIKILFYGSFLLYQELRILLLLGNKISEIHLTDYAYKNFLNNKDESYILVFSEFIRYVESHKWNIKFYIHSDPDKLKNSIIFQRRFDIVCGIDIDYVKGNTNNRPIMKDIAENTLKINGVMFMSQHNLDQVDLCRYEITCNGKIKLVSTEDFVKKEYYLKYMAQDMLCKLYYPFSFIGLFFSAIILNKSPITALIGGTYCIVGIFHKYLMSDDDPNEFERNINNFSNLLKQ